MSVKHKEEMIERVRQIRRGKPWRVGRSLGRTLYLGDEVVGILDTPALAEEVVLCCEAAPVLLAELDSCRTEAQEYRQAAESYEGLYADEIEKRRAAEAALHEHDLLRERLEGLANEFGGNADRAWNGAEALMEEGEDDQAEVLEERAMVWEKAEKALRAALAKSAEEK